MTLNLPEISFRGPASVLDVRPSSEPAPADGHVLRVVRFRDNDDYGSVLLGNWEPPPEHIARWMARRREIRLRMDHPNGEFSEVDLLRTVDWLAAAGVQENGRIFLDLPENGLRGWANVLSVRPCGPIEPGPGGIITGLFRHSRGRVGDLVLASEPEPIGVTPGHLFWSVDRHDWVPVGSLRPGETLETATGTTRVISYTLTDRFEPTYNIEVEGDHCYRVGESGVLVHNASVPPPGVDYGCENKSGKGRYEPCTGALLKTQLGGCSNGYQAHHLIACSVRNSEAIKRAVQLGFDINGRINGWCLPDSEAEATRTGLPLHTGRHLSSNEGGTNYFECVKSLLDELDAELVRGVVNDCNLCAKVAEVIAKIRTAMATHKIWLQRADPNQGANWACPKYS